MKQILGKRSRQEAFFSEEASRPQDCPSDATYTHVPWNHTPHAPCSTANFPSEAEAYRLLDVFISSMGVSQHFFDQRAFSDAMDELYRQEPAKREASEGLWFVEFLLVVAIAKLVEGQLDTGRPPGVSELLEATRRLPSIGEMRQEGVLAVEILALTAVYYQCCGRKDDAYIQVSDFLVTPEPRT